MGLEDAGRILLLSGDRKLAGAVRERLMGLGYGVAGPVAACAQAIQLAVAEPFDLLLAEIGAAGPGEAVAAARELRRKFGVGTVFLCSHPDMPWLEEVLSAEPSGFVAPPYHANALRAAIETARKQFRQAQRFVEREWLASTTQRLGRLGHWHRNLVTGASSVSEGWRRILCVDSADPEPLARLQERVHPEDRDRVMQANAEAVGRHKPVEYRFRAVLPDGTVRHIHGVVEALYDKDGVLAGIGGIDQDITERVRTEESVRRSEAQLRTALRIAQLGAWEHDLVSGRATVSDEVYSILGQDPASFVPTIETFLSQIVPEDRERWWAKADRSLADKTVFRVEDECGVRRPDGQVRVVHTLSEIERAEDGTPLRVIGSIQDITERRQGEDALRRSQRLLQTVFDAVPYRMFLRNRTGQYQLVNRAWSEEFGLPPGGAIGRSALDVLRSSSKFTPETLSRIEKLDKQVLETGLPAEVPEQPMSGRDGSPRVNRITRLPVQDEAGKVIGLVGMAEDITERVKTEESVRRSEARLRTAQRIAQLGAWEHDFVTGTTTWSDETYRILGRDPAGFVPTRETYVGQMEPEDRERWRAEADRILADKTVVRVEDECRLRRPDGEVRVVHTLREIERAPDGTPLRVVGAIQDITERRRIESEMRAREAMLQAVFDAIPHHVFLKDREGRHIKINKSMEQWWGGAQAVIGYRAGNEDRRPPEELATILAGDRRVLAGERFVEAGTITRPDGTVRQYHAIKVPLRDADGQVAGIVGVAEDITDRVRAEAERLRLASAVEHASDGILVTDLNGIIQYANPALSAMTGYSNAELVGSSTKIFRSGTHQPEFYPALWNTILAGNTWRGRYRNRTKDGAICIVDTQIAPIRDPAGAITQFVAVYRDITTQLRLEEQLQRSRHLEAIGTLAGGIAHNMNNLLAPILGFAELLRDNVSGEPEREALLNPIIDAAIRGRDLVRRVLNYSSRSSTSRGPIFLGPIAGEVLALLRASVPPSIAIESAIPEGMPPVEGDSAQVHELLMNLCINAAQAMPDGGTLRLRLEPVQLRDRPGALGKPLSGDFLSIEVSDTGLGMTPEVQSHLFEPFYTTKDVGQGTGLGLSTVWGIVQEHGGAIDVRSRPGEGSAFTVYLPLVAATAPQPAESVAAPLAGTESILCVDDEPAVAAVLGAMLQRLGYSASVFVDPAAALRAVREEPRRFDLVISDFAMPEIDGERLACGIHAIRSDLPVVICTGNDEHVPGAAGRTPDIAGVLLKPVERDALSREIRRILDRSAQPAPG
ncbi:MAG: PAS domain S-box protein [SAR324 cluster bacterium]